MSFSWIDSLSCLSASSIDDVPAVTREKIALNPEIRDSFLKDILIQARRKDNRASLFYLPTCHRIELYGYGLDIEYVLKKWRSISGDSLSSMKIFQGSECLKHWIRVASSLESEVLGETQISGQMKDAFEEARSVGLLAGPLDRIAQRVLRSVKRLRTSLPFGEGTVSVAHVAVDGLEDFFEDLHTKTALIVGAGTMAKQCLHRLQFLGIKQIFWANRSLARIHESGLLSNQVIPVPFAEIHSLIWRNPITVAATASHERLITFEQLMKAKPQDQTHESRVILDLGLPRNVEEKIHGQCSFFLRDVDEFSTTATLNSEKRRNYMALAEILIEQELLQIEESTRNWSQVPLIKELIDLIDSKKESHLERFKLEKESDIEYITGNIYSSLLHGILKEVERLDENASTEFLQNLLRAWRHSGQWRQRQRAEQVKRIPQKNLQVKQGLQN